MTTLASAALRLARAYCAWMETKLGTPASADTLLELNAAEAAFREAEKAETVVEDYGPDRCDVCGWSLAVSRDLGCVKGDCSYRPREGSDEWYRIRARIATLAPKPEAAL